jgi:PIN domain nuclease of toxin-antitoxin system
MRLLLDTHILLWAATGNLPGNAVQYISDELNMLFFSPASIWEIVIKREMNRVDFTVDPVALYRGLLDNGYEELSITAKHTLLVRALPQIHKDPFDRILIAQAASEGVTLLTSDDTVARYPGSIIHVRN